MKKCGFTIIEVALVIAVAGLIFLIVFIAMPALQRNANDTKRKEDISKLLSEVSTYQNSHRGALPDDYSSFINAEPSGELYNLIKLNCNTKTVGSECTDAPGKAILSDFYEAFFPDDYNLLIITGASCNGEKAIATSSQRKLAVLYHLESGGIYCNNI